MACVGNDADLREVTLGKDGAFSGMKKAASSSITPPPRRRSRANSSPKPKTAASTSSMRRSRVDKPARKTARLP
jgi:hypothetical protein